MQRQNQRNIKTERWRNKDRDTDGQIGRDTERQIDR
jgi:hypothetical protein